MNRNRILIIVVVVLVLGFLWILSVSYPSPWTVKHLPRIMNIISLRDVGLCASICIYPSPELSATIFVNGSAPLSTLHLFINGTDEGIFPYSNTMTQYALLFKAGPNNPAMPIVDEKTYVITLAATFQDNSTCTVSATVVASSGSGITTMNGTQFDMIGTFSIVYVPCAANVQCNPQYQLAGTDGNSYQLIFILSIPTTPVNLNLYSPLPNQGERIEVIGTFSPYNGNCFLNGQPTPCQPIGKVIVSSWKPA